jgi:hypothetical protein
VIRDWFEWPADYAEGNYDDTRSRLEVEGQKLRSRVNRRSYGIGKLDLVSLRTLRERVSAGTSFRAD